LTPNLESADQFCAYPITNFKRDWLEPNLLFSERVHELPNLFGKPTRLFSPNERYIFGSIYDPQQSLFYLRSISNSLNWFVVGNADSYSNFILTTRLYSDHLWKKFKEQKWNSISRQHLILELSLRLDVATEDWKKTEVQEEI